MPQYLMRVIHAFPASSPFVVDRSLRLKAYESMLRRSFNPNALEEAPAVGIIRVELNLTTDAELTVARGRTEFANYLRTLMAHVEKADEDVGVSIRLAEAGESYPNMSTEVLPIA